uniref:Uncharacterized protein n=1 Tax=Oryza glumipatula TaxID=40148 RepID=A0A0E0B7U0_9ORYZ
MERINGETPTAPIWAGSRRKERNETDADDTCGHTDKRRVASHGEASYPMAARRLRQRSKATRDRKEVLDLAGGHMAAAGQGGAIEEEVLDLAGSHTAVGCRQRRIGQEALNLTNGHTAAATMWQRILIKVYEIGNHNPARKVQNKRRERQDRVRRRQKSGRKIPPRETNSKGRRHPAPWIEQKAAEGKGSGPYPTTAAAAEEKLSRRRRRAVAWGSGGETEEDIKLIEFKDSQAHNLSQHLMDIEQMIKFCDKIFALEAFKHVATSQITSCGYEDMIRKTQHMMQTTNI